MKQRHWLDLTEYALLTGTGIGAAASLLFQHAIYMVTPLSLLVAVGLWNRQRFDQITQQTARQAVEQVNQQVGARFHRVEASIHNRPSEEAFMGFQQALLLRNKESLSRFKQHSNDLVQRMNQYQYQLNQLNFDHLEHGVGDLQRHYHRINEMIDDLTTQISRSPSSRRVETMETAITDLKLQMMRLRVNVDNLHSETRNAVHPLHDRIESLALQLNHLSRQTDTTTIKQEVGELIKAVTDLVPKRDLVEVSSTITQLQQHQRSLEKAVSGMEDTLRKKNADLQLWTNHHQAHLAPIADLQTEVAQLKASLNQLTDQVTPTPGMTPQAIEAMLRQLPTTLDMTALQKQVQELSDRLDGTTAHLRQAQPLLTDIQNHPLHQHQLLFDVPRQPQTLTANSTPNGAKFNLLDSILAQAQRQLILICPWSNQHDLDDQMIQRFKALLERKVRLELGWCHRGDRREGRFLASISQRWLTAATQRRDLQQVLNQLLPLKQRYPDLFKFKILGTNEQFLVCDREFALLGMPDLTLHNTVFPDLRVWLQTTDPEVVQRLIQRLQKPTIDRQDVIAFFNRATTRYDLSDLTGALEDYNQVIHLAPTDAIAYNNRGLVRYDLNDKVGANADFSQAIQLDPQQLSAYCNRGVGYAEQGESALAIADFDQAIYLAPTSPIPYFYRGTQWHKQGHLTAALADFTEAIARQPTAAFIYCYRAALHQSRQQPAAAIADLTTAITQFNQQGDTVSAQRVKRTLRSLRIKPEVLLPNSAVM